MPSFSKFLSSLTGSSSLTSTSGTRKTSSHPNLHSINSNSRIQTEYTSPKDIDFYHTSLCNTYDPKSPIRVTVAVESPPLVLYSSPEESSGAFFSGTFVLDIFMNQINSELSNLNKSLSNTSISTTAKLHSKLAESIPSNANSVPGSPVNKPPALEPMLSMSQMSPNLTHDYVILTNVSIYLIQITKYGKPFLPSSATLQNCKECTKKTVELARWDILTRKTAFAKGSSHSCPFSHVLPGNIPPTAVLSSVNTSIKYELVAKVTYLDGKEQPQTINLAQPLLITRSILREQDRNSTRIFPPTDVAATAVIPNVVYPSSTFPVEIRMDNISSPKRRWRMRKLNWRLEESVCIRANHCDSHTEKYNQVLEATKAQKKMAKVSKNSGGIGRANVNYFFGVPKKNLNNNNNSIDAAAARMENIHPSDDIGLAPQASNWSMNPTSSNSTLEPSISTNLDRILSANASVGATESGRSASRRLANPDEVVLAPVPEKIPEPEMYIEEIRTISSGELKSGWKSDFSGKGRIELVVEVSLMNLISMGFNNSISCLGPLSSQNCNSLYKSTQLYDSLNADCNCSTDIEDKELGIYVTHNLIMEIVVAEELMQSTLAGPNTLHAQRSRPTISSNAAIATGNVHSQSRTRSHNSSAASTPTPGSPSNSGSAGSSTPTSRANQVRTTHTLSADDFPDDRVGPDSATGNKSDSSNHLQGIPTGVARVLRMQFKVILCERSGFGLAWDDEVPPTYHAVGPLSPPNYAVAITSPTPNLHGLVVPLDDEPEKQLGSLSDIANLEL